MQKEWDYSASSSKRLDHFLVEKANQYSRSQWGKWIKEGRVTVNDKVRKASYPLEEGDKVTFFPPEEKNVHLPLAEAMTLEIVYEDKDLLVVNKPSGLVVHPSKDHETGTLVNGLLAHVQAKGERLAHEGESFRPGIVHRIDKDTSGLLVMAKTEAAFEGLSDQIQSHQAKRSYLALAYGEVTSDQGTITYPLKRHPVDRMRYIADLEGKSAVTHYKRLSHSSDYTLLELDLETGRTHQIRAHLAAIHHPLVDDPLYAKSYRQHFFQQDGQCLHAYRLAFKHPISHEDLVFSVPLPATFRQLIVHTLGEGALKILPN